MGGAIPGGGPADRPGGAAVATGAAGAVSGVPQAWQYRLPSGF